MRRLIFGMNAMLIIYACFGMGGMVGANTAMNDTESYSHAHGVLDELTEEAMSNATENVSGMRQTFVEYTVQPTVWTAEQAALVGLWVGHTSPLAGQAIGYSVPVFTVGFLLVMIHRLWRLFR